MFYFGTVEHHRILAIETSQIEHLIRHILNGNGDVTAVHCLHQAGKNGILVAAVPALGDADEMLILPGKLHFMEAEALVDFAGAPKEIIEDDD